MITKKDLSDIYYLTDNDLWVGNLHFSISLAGIMVLIYGLSLLLNI